MKKIIVDLTPLLPGGNNGGAKIMTIELIKELARLSPKCKFVLLANNKNYAELKYLKNKQFKIINTDYPTISAIILICLGYVLFFSGKLFYKITPPILTTGFKKLNIFSNPFLRALKSLKERIKNKNFKINELIYVKADLLFCPFTVPFYKHFNIPIVSVIYDLQAYYYPYFFSEAEAEERKGHLHYTCRYATQLISISKYVKKTILENINFPENKITPIPIRLAKRFEHCDTSKRDVIVNDYALTVGNYLLYPANFWAHKNHQLLFTAFTAYCHRNPTSSLKLVCTGADNSLKQDLLQAIIKMNMMTKIIFTEYLSDQSLHALLKGSRAIIFPSLFEGFGMPVLEAMSAGVPVLCSNQTSLPEIAGAAALYFNPKKPEEMIQAIHQIDTDDELVNTLIQNGLRQSKQFEDITLMAKEYWQVFQTARESYK